jgi:hypothetical protein
MESAQNVTQQLNALNKRLSSIERILPDRHWHAYAIQQIDEIERRTRPIRTAPVDVAPAPSAAAAQPMVVFQPQSQQPLYPPYYAPQHFPR